MSARRILATHLRALSIDVDRLANLRRCVGEATCKQPVGQEALHASTKPPALWCGCPGQNRTSGYATSRATASYEAAAHADPTSPTGAAVLAFLREGYAHGDQDRPAGAKHRCKTSSARGRASLLARWFRVSAAETRA